MSVLVVEANLAIRYPLSEYLRECGYRVYEAADTDEAVSLLTKFEADIHVVLCDVLSVGRFDGFGLAKWIRDHMPRIQVALATTPERVTKQAAGLCEEADVVKPYDHQLLLDKIKRLLAKRDAAINRGDS
jgi:DNA-binding response OmpR family regulator